MFSKHIKEENLTHAELLQTLPVSISWYAEPEDCELVDPVSIIIATAMWSVRYLGLVQPEYEPVVYH